MTATISLPFTGISLREDVCNARVAVIKAEAWRSQIVASAEMVSVTDPAHDSFARLVEQAAEAVIDARQALADAEARRDRWV